MPYGLLLTADPVIFANVFVEPPHSEELLFIREPAGRSWEIWENEICARRD